MLGETRDLQPPPTVPQHSPMARPESPVKDFHGNSCLEEGTAEGFPYSHFRRGGVFGNTEFYLDFCFPLCKLCNCASLVLAPGRGNVRDDLQLGGCREGHWSPLGKRMCRGNTSVELVGFFFLSSLPGFTFVCAFQTEGKQNLHGCGKLGES